MSPAPTLQTKQIQQRFVRRASLPALLFAIGFVVSVAFAALNNQQGSPSQESVLSQNDQRLDVISTVAYRAQDDDEKLPPKPFARQFDPNFEFPRDAEWLNTSGAIRMRDLRGKFVIFDFWTYCCINCMHILPVLEKMEEKYPNQLVVIGVHSAKFENEKDAQNIREAILRYNIKHPVVNDPEHEIWDKFPVNSWPTLIMMDPEGKLVWGVSGEVGFETLDKTLGDAIPYYRAKGTLDEQPLQFELHAFSQPKTPLRFPGKVLADADSDRLYIADSNHHRIVVSTLDGKLIETIGNGKKGVDDGGYQKATFNQPQGMALDGNLLYVADTENHMIRKIDLESKQVSTIAGVGTQGREAFPGLRGLTTRDEFPDRWVGKPLETAINSPWALWVHDDELFIAMAGPHQIWKLNAEGTEIGPYAGNGREDIVDGPLEPKEPYAEGASSFAQPSGLASDGEWLYVADSEGSSIRAVPFDSSKEVRTVIGTSGLPYGRLFHFGDVDGTKDKALLQHPLGVVHLEGKLYITDTYNNKIKIVDAKTGKVTTLAGTGEPGTNDSPAQFDEPAGLTLAGETLFIADTNNHLIRKVSISDGKVETLEIDGLRAPVLLEEPKRRRLSDAPQGKVTGKTIKAIDGHAQFKVKLELPLGWKLNPDAPLTYRIVDETFDGPVDNSAVAEDGTRVSPIRSEFDVKLPVLATAGSDEVTIEVTYYYCQEGGEGLCKVGGVQWQVPFELKQDAEAEAIELTYEITDQ